MMWNDSHESWRTFLIRCYSQWTNKEGITKEAAADAVVMAHNGQGAQAKTGLHFNPASVTEANRMKANCATLTRNMEKEDLVDLLPYILAAMSDEYKLAFISQYLRPAGIVCRLADSDSQEGLSLESVCETQIAAAEAFKAIAEATMNPTAQNLDIAEREAVKATEKFKRIRAFIGGARAKCKTVMGKFHRKQPA